MRVLVTAAAIGSLLAGCAYGPGEPNEYGVSKSTLGAVLGGLGGAAAGGMLFGGRHGVIGRGGTTQALGAIGGGLLGAYAGHSFGRTLDRADQAHAQRASQQARTAPVGQPIRWSNPDSGNHGTVVATREGQSAAGEYCREFQQTITVGGRTERGFGTACRQPDGSWRIVQ
jgi:surface antigen